jgi:uncharacterized protein with HEPN domain
MPRDSRVYLDDILEAARKIDVVTNKLPELEESVSQLLAE